MDVIQRSFLPDPARKQHWKYAYLRYDVGVNSQLLVNASIDEGGYVNQAKINLNGATTLGLDYFTLDVSTLGGGSTAKTRVNFSQLVGKTLSVEFYESSTSPVTIYDREFYYLPKGLRAN